MTDLRLRELERTALAEGDEAAIDRLLRRWHRVGAINHSRLSTLAALGVPAARDLVRGRPPRELAVIGNLWSTGGSPQWATPWREWKQAFRSAGRWPTALVVRDLQDAWAPDWETRRLSERPFGLPQGAPSERLGAAVRDWFASGGGAEEKEQVRAGWRRMPSAFQHSPGGLFPLDRILRRNAIAVTGEPLRALRETLAAVQHREWSQPLGSEPLGFERIVEVARKALVQQTLQEGLGRAHRHR